MKLAIIDYGMGNLKSITSVFKYHGIENIVITHDLNELKSADKLLLPGVGSFAKAMDNINRLNIHKTLDELVLESKKPILGICLGMQLLCKSSEEDGGAEGLGYIDAVCERFKTNDIKIPHVGFNQVKASENSKLFHEISDNNDFYFTHSYRLSTDTDINQSLTLYGEEFVSAYELDNIVGTQFHPELSQTNGLKLIKNFLEKF